MTRERAGRYVFGRHKDAVFLKLQALLEPCGLMHDSSDHKGAYTRYLDPKEHTASTHHTQKIVRTHLTIRTRIERLVRQTIYFDTTTQMPDMVMGLLVNRPTFGQAVYMGHLHFCPKARDRSLHGWHLGRSTTSRSPCLPSACTAQVCCTPPRLHRR